MIIELTPEQVQAMRPLTAKVLADLKQGRHSCIVAQVLSRFNWDLKEPIPTMNVQVFDEAVTNKLQEVFMEAGHLTIESKIHADMNLDELQAYLRGDK